MKTKRRVLIISVSAMSCLAQAAESNSGFGSYVCVAHRTVGLQGDAKKQNRFAGKIALPSEEERFLIKISNINNSEREWCKSEKVGTNGSLVADEYSYWWQCNAKSELKFSTDKYPLPLRGDDMHVFQDSLSGWFHIGKNLKYVFAYTDFGGNYYLEEGVCQKK